MTVILSAKHEESRGIHEILRRYAPQDDSREAELVSGKRLIGEWVNR